MMKLEIVVLDLVFAEPLGVTVAIGRGGHFTPLLTASRWTHDTHTYLFIPFFVPRGWRSGRPSGRVVGRHTGIMMHKGLTTLHSFSRRSRKYGHSYSLSLPPPPPPPLSLRTSERKANCPPDHYRAPSGPENSPGKLKYNCLNLLK